jgi:transcriptional regulator with XRE-family HTH domain
MERIEYVNPQRIEWCCADRGITLDQLATEVGIPVAAFEKLQAGKPALTFIQLRKVAEFLGRGTLFFLDPGPVDAARVHTAQFRTLAQQKPELSPNLKSLIERVEKKRDL